MIVRAPRPEGNFYVLSKAISEDKRLSWAARGLLVYLLGKPDHWKVSPAAIINETAESAKHSRRDAVYGLLDELQATGYMVREQRRDAGGVLGPVSYLVREIATTPLTEKPDTAPLPGSPLPGEPYTGEPLPANPLQASIEVKQEPKKEQLTKAPAALVETAGAALDLFGGKLAEDTTPTKFKAEVYIPPPCPYEQIASAYCELLPQLPGITILSDVRRRSMQARWREVCGTEKLDVAGGLDFFRWFFGRVATSQFLMGRSPAARGKERAFKADFDWLLTPTYFTKVVEGRYHESTKETT